MMLGSGLNTILDAIRSLPGVGAERSSGNGLMGERAFAAAFREATHLDGPAIRLDASTPPDAPLLEVPSVTGMQPENGKLLPSDGDDLPQDVLWQLQREGSAGGVSREAASPSLLMETATRAGPAPEASFIEASADSRPTLSESSRGEASPRPDPALDDVVVMTPDSWTVGAVQSVNVSGDAGNVNATGGDVPDTEQIAVTVPEAELAAEWSSPFGDRPTMTAIDDATSATGYQLDINREEAWVGTDPVASSDAALAAERPGAAPLQEPGDQEPNTLRPTASRLASQSPLAGQLGNMAPFSVKSPVVTGLDAPAEAARRTNPSGIELALNDIEQGNSASIERVSNPQRGTEVPGHAVLPGDVDSVSSVERSELLRRLRPVPATDTPASSDVAFDASDDVAQGQKLSLKMTAGATQQSGRDPMLQSSDSTQQPILDTDGLTAQRETVPALGDIEAITLDEGPTELPPKSVKVSDAVPVAPAVSPNTQTTVARTTLSAGVPDQFLDALQHAPDAPEFPEEMLGRLRVMQNNGQREARLNLHPAELGRLTITVTTEGDNARVAFTVDNPQAREAIETAMPRLRDLLDQAGLQLADGSVSEQHQGTGERWHAESVPEDAPRSTGSDDDIVVDATVATQSHRSDGLFDAYA